MSTATFNLVLVIFGLGLLVWRGFVATQVGLDARRRGFEPNDMIRWALVAVVAADRYWWGARLDRMPVPEARELLAETARAHGLLSVVNVRCPLCDYEIANALAVAASGELYIRRQATCAHCDFRVDACRHCAHFQPAADGATTFDRQGDFSHGRCGFYRSMESVRAAYPLHANRLEAMGYDVLPTPKPVVDSFIPLADCTAFSLKLEHLHQSKVPWIDRQRVALIRLHQKTRSSQSLH
jgi:hypothetical protein